MEANLEYALPFTAPAYVIGLCYGRLTGIFSGAKELLEEYWEKLGGKPVPGTSGGKKKRAQQSVGGTPDTSAKKPKVGAGRKGKGASSSKLPDKRMVGTEEPDEDWKPPAGSWEERVQIIETIEKTEDDKLYAFVLWTDCGNDGKYIRSKQPLDHSPDSCYEHCLRKVSWAGQNAGRSGHRS